MSKILILGDIHGVWEHANALIDKQQPDSILQAGDFGYWPRQHQKPQDIEFKGDEVILKVWDQFGLKNHRQDGSLIEVLATPGNHEDWWSLKEEWDQGKTEVMPGVHIFPRGTTYTLPDGRTILFFGGAHSIDKLNRKVGIDWFADECPGQREVLELPDVHVDIVISHTCPEEFLVWGAWRTAERAKDPTVAALSYILEKYKPSLWYFGHWHEFAQGEHDGCRWTCLNMAGETGWWTWLPDKEG